MNYKFSESILAVNFRKSLFQQVTSLINQGTSFSIIGLPYIGVPAFLRFLATKKIANFIYLDVHSLPTRNAFALFHALYKELGGKKELLSEVTVIESCIKHLRTFLSQNKPIVIIISRFDFLKEECTPILSTLKSLEDVGRGRVIIIISTHKPLHEINPNTLSEVNTSLISKVLYFPPFSGNDEKEILKICPVNLRTKKELSRILKLAGGHGTLILLLLKTDSLLDPLKDPYILLHLKDILHSFNASQRQMIKKIAFGKKVKLPDSHLIKTGMLKKQKSEYILFSPLMRHYIVNYESLKLSKKESIIFYLLKKNLGKSISKQKIFDNVWGDNNTSATDWALNALIYRLRKNPTFKNKGYFIENYKGIGYRMIRDI